MRERVRILLVIYGLLLAAAGSTALKPTRPKFKIATSSTTTTTEEPEPEEPEVTTVQTDVNATTARVLTGIPQIDYIWDPNLPRELNGYNLSTYPFYSTVPVDEIDFKCDGLHDGFYASIKHKCQVYHHCLYGTRYDFLCANFTAFDQKTFICHFASEVDCANSKNYWHRNDALYQATTTTTTSTTTTPAPPTAAPVALPAARPSFRERDPINRRRRPSYRRRPAYDYYDDEYYDEEYDRTRPRGYDRRDSYEYDDRNYRTDRDRDRDRERDYRDPERDRNVRHRERDNPSGYGASRDVSDHRTPYDDRDQRERDKIPAARPNRRDRRPVDQFNENPRPLARDRPRDSDVVNYPDEKVTAGDERRKDSPDLRARDSTRDTDDRRYSDKRYRIDYDDKDPAPVATGSSDGLVKPAAPSTSVYARPRAPPKIRRPVPVSEKNKYAYNTSAVAANAAPNESRRRPAPVDDDYLEDDLEDARPRRPARRRPAYRDKEPYDARETRDQDRDRDRERNYRTRYQDADEDEVLPRKRPDRQRDRNYDRGDRLHGYDRDRSALDRGVMNPAVTDRPAAQFPSRSAERPTGLMNTRVSNRDENFTRSKFLARERELPIAQTEAPKKQTYYQREEKTSVDSPVQTFRNQNDEDEDDDVLHVVKEPSDTVRSKGYREKNNEPRYSVPEVIPEQPLTRPSTAARGSQKYEESSAQNPTGIDYAAEGSSEYYDEPEEVPVSSPRTTLRIVKRPFLPSRGGNPNPRGLKQVGLRVEPKPDDSRSSERPARINTDDDGTSDALEERSYTGRRRPYDAYRSLQSDGRQQSRDEAIDEGVVSRPQTRRLQKDDSPNGQEDFVRSSDREDLNNREGSGNEYNRQSSQSQNDRTPSESSQKQGSTVVKSQGNSVKQPNEVGSRLQDIPESEYDVTLNDALTPTLSQESSLPSGFILPLHRQLEKDTNLQSSQRTYLFTRPTESVSQQKSSLSSGPSSSFSVPPIIERSRTTFPRQPPDTIFAPGHQQAPWQGFGEY